MDYSVHYAEIERRFDRLLAILPDMFLDNERNEILESIEHSEYGCALEILVAILTEHKLAHEVCEAISDLAKLMEMDGTPAIKTFKRSHDVSKA